MKKLILLFFMCPSAFAGDWWTENKLTNGLMVSANILMIADWAQTRHIADNQRYHEIGFAKNFIGSDPSSGDVNQYFSASLILMNLTGYLLPEKYKDMFYAGVSIYQADYIKSNNEIGIQFEF